MKHRAKLRAKRYSHKSEELESLLGKRIRIRFFDGAVVSGVLSHDEWNPRMYKITPTCGCYTYTFYKSHLRGFWEE